MKHSDNFKLVIEAIQSERNNNPSAGLIELRQTKENKLTLAFGSGTFNQFFLVFDDILSLWKYLPEKLPSSTSSSIIITCSVFITNINTVYAHLS